MYFIGLIKYLLENRRQIRAKTPTPFLPVFVRLLQYVKYFSSALAITGAVTFFTGIASGKRVVKHIIVNKNWLSGRIYGNYGNLL